MTECRFFCRPGLARYCVLVLGFLFCTVPLLAQETPVDLEKLPWSGQRVLTSLEAHTIAPTIIADENGLHVIYQELRTMGNSTVSYMSSQDLGKTWINRQVLASAYSMGVGTSLLSHKGVLHALWCPTERGINGLNYRRSRDGGKKWDPERVLTETKRAIYLPKLFVDGDTLYLVWTEKMVMGSDLASRAPTVQDLDIRTMTMKEEKKPSLIQESYDCTLNLMTSQDEGNTWSAKLVIERVFEDIRAYNFSADGPHLTFNLLLKGRKYKRLESRDRGLVWQRQDISEQEFGAFEPPSVVKHGKNYFHIGAKEIEGRNVIYLTRTDYEPPEVTVLNQEPEVESDSVTVRWSGQDDWTDAERLQYRYRVNDATPSAWSETHETELSALGDGQHELAVEVRDDAGNVCVHPAVYSFEVKVPPDTQIQTQLPQLITEKSVKIEWAGTDNTTPAEALRFLVSLDDSAWREVKQERSTVLSSLTDGRHRFAVKAVDQSGNVDPTPAVIEFYLDSLPPKTLSAEVGKWVPGTQRLSCQITAEDNISAPDKILFSLQLNQGEPSRFVRFPTLPVQKLKDGENRLAIRAKDEAGNVEEPAYEQTFTVEIPPQLEIVSGPVAALPKADFEVICEVRDNSTPPEKILLSYRIGEEPWSPPVPGQVFRIQRPNLPPGRHELQIRAMDERGNESVLGAESTTAFLIDPGQLPPPENIKISPQPSGVLLTWSLPSSLPPQGVLFQVYRSSKGGFGVTPEERRNYLIADSRPETSYLDHPPAATGEISIRYLYAVTLSQGARESPLSRMVAVEVSPQGKAQQVATARATQTASPAVAVVLLAALLLLLILALLVVLYLIFRRKPPKVEPVATIEDDDDLSDRPWERKEV